MTELVRPLPEAFRPYAWAAPTAEIAARHGLHPAAIIRFDQNVPPLPGVPQVPLGESFARLNEYPDGTYRDLREAAAEYAGVDLLPARDGTLHVLEVNGIPGWSGVQSVTETDIAGAIVDRLATCTASARGP